MKKRTLTLLEIMIVIFLITLITGTIGYSMRGTLDKGRAFKTEQAKEQLHDLLLIALAEGADPDSIVKDPAGHLKQLGLAKDPKNLVKDGWKKDFEITLNANKTDFTIYSDPWQKYKDKQKRDTPGSATANPSENDE